MTVTMSPQGIISKLKDFYGHLGVASSVVSEKRNRMLICVSLSSETTPSVKTPLPTGHQVPESTSLYMARKVECRTKRCIKAK